MKYLKSIKYLTLICAMVIMTSCASQQANNATTKTVENVQEDEDPSVIDQPNSVEKIDAFIALVEKYKDDLKKVEQETTGDGDKKRGDGAITAYFQGDYAIKWIETAEIEGSIVKETYYLYNLKPIYIDQVITDSENNIEGNIAYMNKGKVLKWIQNGKTMDNKNKELRFTLEFERFKN